MRGRCWVVGGLLGAALLPGCSTDDPSQGVTIVTSIYPLQMVAERVGGDHVAVTNLTSPGQEPHDLELTIEQTAQLTDADLVVYGAGFQPALDEAAQDVGGAVVEALEVLEDDDGITGAAPVRVIEDDPHFWLDPVALATVAAEVARQLGEVDPGHAGDYEQNAATLQAELVALDREITSALDDCARRTVVVSHDAFGYFGARYDLDLEAVNGLSPEAEPSPQHIAELHKLIRTEGITTVFSETLASPVMAETLAADLGLRTAVLDPIEGLTDETADDDYVSLTRANLEALREANGCR